MSDYRPGVNEGCVGTMVEMEWREEELLQGYLPLFHLSTQIALSTLRLDIACLQSAIINDMTRLSAILRFRCAAEVDVYSDAATADADDDEVAQPPTSTHAHRSLRLPWAAFAWQPTEKLVCVRSWGRRCWCCCRCWSGNHPPMRPVTDVHSQRFVQSLFSSSLHSLIYAINHLLDQSLHTMRHFLYLYPSICLWESITSRRVDLFPIFRLEPETSFNSIRSLSVGSSPLIA